MPVHDWTRVDAGIFHSFHNGWIAHLGGALNAGILPQGYYALGEQHAGRYIADVLTLHTSKPNELNVSTPPPPQGGIALADAPPKVRRQLTGVETYRQLRRSLAIRHVSGHRLIALVEIVSPANKDRLESVDELVSKTIDAIDLGIQVLLVDILPPGRHDPRGIHGAIWNQFDEGPYDFPLDEPLTLASYKTGLPVTAFVEHVAVGGALPEQPLFLSSERYVPTPLEATYQAAWRDAPSYWRDVLEGGGT